MYLCGVIMVCVELGARYQYTMLNAACYIAHYVTARPRISSHPS